MKNVKNLSVATFVMMNVAAIVSLRGLPAEAEYGLSSIIYYLFAAICFLVPVAMASAQMATTFPQQGGVFRWVGEAFSPRFGFLAIWLQWLQNSIWFPTVLTFAVVSLAFIGGNMSHDLTLSANKFYMLALVLGVYWIATFANFFGIRLSGAITKWGTIIGTLVPAATLIVFGAAYAIMGGDIQMPMHASDLIPKVDSFNSLNLAISVFLFFTGLEMSAVHIKEMKNPASQYPKSIFITVAMVVTIFILGTLALGFVIPQSEINLTQSLLVGYNKLFEFFHVPFLGRVMAALLALGVFASVTTWIAGPSKGMLAVGQAGYLPKFFQRTNKRGVQTNILLLQAAIVTVLGATFVLLPSIQSAYQILTALTVAMYLIMYILMFAAFIKLRHQKRTTPGTFVAPMGMTWGILGLLASVVAFVLSYFPPSQIPVGSPVIWVGLLIAGTAIGVAAPFVIYALRKPDWKNPKSDFEPFSYERRKK